MESTEMQLWDLTHKQIYFTWAETDLNDISASVQSSIHVFCRDTLLGQVQPEISLHDFMILMTIFSL